MTRVKPIPAHLAPLKRYIPEPNSGCFIWVGTSNRYGYGVIRRGGKVYTAHRYAWAIQNGDPGSLCVLHRCDNRLCVNPNHLFLGTPADNTADMVAKGRSPRTGGAKKLTQEQADAIRADTRTQKLIAREFGVSQPTISAIKAGQRYLG